MQRLTRGIRVKLVLFVALALAGTTYLGATHVGFSPFSDGARITVSLPEAGGLFVNSEVTYRGVQIGEVTALEASSDGVEAMVELDPDAPAIPADVTVHVVNRSAIGEQYLDLRGSSTTETLAAGAHLEGGTEALPQEISEVIRTARDFSASVPSDALDTVIDEGYLLSQGAGEDLRRLVRTSLEFQQAADRNFMVSESLITNSRQVLATQEEAAGSIRAFSNDLGLFARTLSDSDADLRTLIEASPAAARQISLLVRDVGQPLGILMSNLISTATIFGTNAAGVEDAMIHLPEAISIGWSISTSKGLSMGLVPTFFDPLPCTKGYDGTQRRRGTDTGKSAPLNTDAGCTASLSSGNVRGPQHLPGAATPTGAAAPQPEDISVVEEIDDLLGGNG